MFLSAVLFALILPMYLLLQDRKDKNKIGLTIDFKWRS